MLTIFAFHSGELLLGYILGGLLTVIGLLVNTIDLCIPSMIYGAIFGRPSKPMHEVS